MVERVSSTGMGRRALAACIVAFAGASVAAAETSTALPLRTVARLPLSGPAVRFDYTSIDPKTHTLWISHMDADELLAFNLIRRKVVRTISAPGVHGVIAVPELNRVYASATNARAMLTINARTGAVIAKASAGEYPDGLAFDPKEKHVFVSDESGGIEAVFNAAGHRIATISLGGDAGNVQFDAGSGHILVDVQSQNQIAVIDPRSNRIIKRVDVPRCSNDHGLLVDSAHRLAFVTCDANARLLTLNLRTMRFTGTFEVGSSPDVLAFDASKRRLYVSAESGVVAVFSETAVSARPLGRSFLAAEAHTVAVDQATHLVYFPLQSGSTGRPQLLVMKPR
jgi:DNA-binding beta-propeller fold protein YncE